MKKHLHFETNSIEILIEIAKKGSSIKNVFFKKIPFYVSRFITHQHFPCTICSTCCIINLLCYVVGIAVTCWSKQATQHFQEKHWNTSLLVNTEPLASQPTPDQTALKWISPDHTGFIYCIRRMSKRVSVWKHWEGRQI